MLIRNSIKKKALTHVSYLANRSDDRQIEIFALKQATPVGLCLHEVKQKKVGKIHRFNRVALNSLSQKKIKKIKTSKRLRLFNVFLESTSVRN